MLSVVEDAVVQLEAQEGPRSPLTGPVDNPRD